MSSLDTKALLDAGFQVEFQCHAAAIMEVDFPGAWGELAACLLDLKIPIEEIIGSGGGEAKGTQRLRRSLAAAGWTKLNFTIEKAINGVASQSISHEVDHVKAFSDGVIALEIEWNNKDPFFDRDLENYKRLHAEGAISLGVLVTRGASLQDQLPNLIDRFIRENEISDFGRLEEFGYIPTARQKKTILSLVEREYNSFSFREAFVRQFVSDKYGTATTHWAKLEDRIHRRVGNPCPLIMIGLPSSIVDFGADAGD